MPDAYFTVLAEDFARGRYAAAAATAGPWSPDLQHGGPPNALLVRAAERVAAETTGRTDLIAMRLATEFVGAVPVGEIEVAARIVRQARSAVLVETALTAAGRTALQGRVWLVRAADTGAVAPTLGDPALPPDGLPGLGGSFPYGDTIEWRAVSGSLRTPGPGIVWARPRLSLVPDERLSGLQRVVLIGDSASGVSSELDFAGWSFVNIDLDVHLSRPVEGDWVLLDARTMLGGRGAALARSTVSDTRGEVGCTAQTLILAPR